MKKTINRTTASRYAKAISLMGFDVDGVLTDGTLYFSSQGEAMKSFSVRDGQGLRFLQQCGVKIAIITSRQSDALLHRARDLDIALVLQGVRDKAQAMQGLAEDHRLALNCCGYMGDDVIDLAVMEDCGFSAAPSDAVGEVLHRASFVSRYPGGHGAVREVCEFIVKAKKLWQPLLKHHLHA